MLSKPGKHGTLRLFVVTYRSDTDPEGREPLTGRFWAYDAEHAYERFHDGDAADAGWIFVSVRRATARDVAAA